MTPRIPDNVWSVVAIMGSNTMSPRDPTDDDEEEDEEEEDDEDRHKEPAVVKRTRRIARPSGVNLYAPAKPNSQARPLRKILTLPPSPPESWLRVGRAAQWRATSTLWRGHPHSPVSWKCRITAASVTNDPATRIGYIAADVFLVAFTVYMIWGLLWFR
jgi:hypothetical protein